MPFSLRPRRSYPNRPRVRSMNRYRSFSRTRKPTSRVPSRNSFTCVSVLSFASFISITMPLIMIDPLSFRLIPLWNHGGPFRLIPFWKRLSLPIFRTNPDTGVSGRAPSGAKIAMDRISPEVAAVFRSCCGKGDGGHSFLPLQSPDFLQ